MAAPLTSLFSISFALALLATLLVAATLRLLAILPGQRAKPTQWRKRPLATRVLIVLGSGGHTHEMFYLLRDLDVRKYTHRTYIVSSGDAFSAQRAVEFEASLAERENAAQKKKKSESQVPAVVVNGQTLAHKMSAQRQACLGPEHYNIAVVPRARKIHQSLVTTPFSVLYTLYKSFAPLLAAPPLLPHAPPSNPYEAAAADLPDLIVTNGPATAVVVILASLILRFFGVRGAHSRNKCRTIYVESFARVKGLSLSGKLLSRVVDRFLVQWEELERKGGGRAEFWGILV
ncbi:oligosaccharide biosynthesis protein Alg14 like-domain-containing protein [Ampelomyces quisqualis]|uniref:UDP-N-acetylglucosamine transferase subunit ALG14 n=1 Tax=Ampelomyces quisqualis TaxID=50730 RepID=A0A6A5R1X9_AMPQU|nr:oligosaccharide biosynthesis protein Alg14 like-domain-containing protein [Ampelomyces quisqualis]